MAQSFQTLKQTSESLIKEKGSRFIGLAAPCRDEEQAKTILNNWREQHPQATHLCFAWRLGVKNPKLRMADDGEPSNSAGAPIYGQIQAFDLYNVILAVVRYYGGTKLGVGGLIQAYRQAAREAIEANEIEESELTNLLEIQFQYEDMPQVMRRIKQYKLETLEQELSNDCKITLQIPQSQLLEVKEHLLGLPSLHITNEIIGT